MIFFRGRKIRKKLQLSIGRAAELSLPDSDVAYAIEFLAVGEYNLCLDHIATQLYEFHIAIDHNCFVLAMELANLMHVREMDYNYLAELLPGNPKVV